MKEKIKEYWWIIIIALFIGGAFYWFQWRPIQIRKEQASIGQQKQEELKMQLLEEQINSLQQETAQKQQEAQ